MEILVHRHSAQVSAKLRELAVKRAHAALDRHAGHVDRVQVYLTDEGVHNGDRHRCRMVAHLLPSGTAVVEETRDRMGAAITRAGNALERAVRRTIERQRSKRMRAA